MTRYPLHFETQTRADAGVTEHWSGGTHKHEARMTLAIPTEFDGPGTGFSPEDLYAAALQNCFVATFKVLARNSGLSFQSLEGNADLTVDRDENGVPWMSRIDLRFALNGVENADLAWRLLEKTSRECMILNSVRTEKVFHFSIDGANEAH